MGKPSLTQVSNFINNQQGAGNPSHGRGHLKFVEKNKAKKKKKVHKKDVGFCPMNNDPNSGGPYDKYGLGTRGRSYSPRERGQTGGRGTGIQCGPYYCNALNMIPHTDVELLSFNTSHVISSAVKSEEKNAIEKMDTVEVKIEKTVSNDQICTSDKNIKHLVENTINICQNETNKQRIEGNYTNSFKKLACVDTSTQISHIKEENETVQISDSSDTSKVSKKHNKRSDIKNLPKITPPEQSNIRPKDKIINKKIPLLGCCPINDGSYWRSLNIPFIPMHRPAMYCQPANYYRGTGYVPQSTFGPYYRPPVPYYNYIPPRNYNPKHTKKVVTNTEMIDLTEIKEEIHENYEVLPNAKNDSSTENPNKENKFSTISVENYSNKVATDIKERVLSEIREVIPPKEEIIEMAKSDTSSTEKCAVTIGSDNDDSQSKALKFRFNINDIDNILLQRAKEILAQNETATTSKYDFAFRNHTSTDNVNATVKQPVIVSSNTFKPNNKTENIVSNVLDNSVKKSIFRNTSKIYPKKVKNKSKVYCSQNAEIVERVPSNCNKLNYAIDNQNVTGDDYNVKDMEIDDDDNTNINNSMESTQSLNKTVPEGIQDIESHIKEIIDIIKTTPTDFETLLDIINHTRDDTDNSLLNDIENTFSDILKTSSSHSLKATTSKERVNGAMSIRERRKRHSKTQHSIQKLFHKLRESTQNQSQINVETSQMYSQRSSQTSIIDLDDTDVTIIPNEINFNNNILQTNDNSILILDDEQKACSTPKRESFRLSNTTRAEPNRLADVILAQSNNNNKSLNETKVINRSSFQTIDLTTESGLNRTVMSQPTVIDISDPGDDVTLVSVSGTSTMSGDSDVTILRQPVSRKLKKFTKGIANLNSEEKGKLLELITQTVFNGCEVPDVRTTGVPNLERCLPRAVDTAEDTYIKEVILGTRGSRSSIGSNVYHPDRQKGVKSGPRMIVIDGSNVAMEHGRRKIFSVAGLKICIEYFLKRGHVVKAFVPRFRCKSGKSSNPRLLDMLERKGFVIYTPSREVQGRTITPYDDRYIIQCAAEFDAVVVSGDQYRDLANENPRWRSVIDHRLLPFTWVDDMLMFPRDPLGRSGPTLEQFLSHPPPDGRSMDFIRIN